MQHKYSVDTVVYHISKRKYARIIDIVNDGDAKRYYIQHSGYTWSVPEQFLRSKQPKNMLKSA